MHMLNQIIQSKIQLCQANKNSFIDYNYYMSQTLFTCVNCQLHFQNQTVYKQHYKSQHHRYNVKRKLIGLVPLSFQDYIIQFQSEQSSKSQSQAEIYCDLCSKKFMSVQTYKQHVNSQKHKQNRKDLLKKSKKDKSQTSSLSQFQVIEDENVKLQCFFCVQSCSQKHLFQKHSFPPFKAQCINLQGLIDHVSKVIKKGQCIYCEQQFGNEESVKQHMADTGHNKLDIDCFEPFQQFYMWKIEESSEQDQTHTQQIQILQQKGDHEDFSILKAQTLNSLQQKRKNRIKHSATGVIINGKQFGYRAYKQYYKQFLTRKVQQAPRQHQRCLPATQQWKKNLKYIQQKPQYQNISFNLNTR